MLMMEAYGFTKVEPDDHLINPLKEWGQQGSL